MQLRVSKTKPVVSAGGIVLKNNATSGESECLVVKRTKGIESKWKPTLCQLPKGGVEKNETLKETALREVLEETGVTATIVCKAGTASWAYKRRGLSLRETVHYYVMKPTAATQRPHDGEFEEVCWLKMSDVVQLLSYPEERQLLLEIMKRELLSCQP